MKSLDELVTPAPELTMHHYDKSMMSPEAAQQAALAAKEASCVQAVGYMPTSNISAQEWELQLERNERSKAMGGEYVRTPDPGRSGSMY